MIEARPIAEATAQRLEEILRSVKSEPMDVELAVQIITLEARYGRGVGRDLARVFFRKRGRLKRRGAWLRYWRYNRGRLVYAWATEIMAVAP